MADMEFNPNTSYVQDLFKEINVSSQIGKGGQKFVYKGYHPTHGDIALKLMKPSNSKARKRILREISASRKLVGPEFSRIYDYGEMDIESNNIIYIFEEFLEEQNLREILQERGKLTLLTTLKITESLLKALVKTCNVNIVHRDIKPENIFVTKEESIILIDFGISRHLDLTSLTDSLNRFGPLTPGYAAPEQIRNKKRKICSRTDIFSLGVVVYECLVGFNPFTKDCLDLNEIIDKCLNFDPPSLCTFGFKEDISHFVETCLQKHLSRRYQSPMMALDVIQDILHKEVN